MEYGHSSCSIGNTLKNSFKSFSLSANLCQWAFRLKNYTRKTLQPEEKSFSQHPLRVCILRTDWFPNASKVLYPGICHRIAPLNKQTDTIRKHILFHQDKFVFSVHHLGEHANPTLVKIRCHLCETAASLR